VACGCIVRREGEEEVAQPADYDSHRLPRPGAARLSDLPPGFDCVYRCSTHPDREVVTPIACRRCQECHDDAIRNYAAQHHFVPTFRYQDERSPDGRSIYLDHKGHYKPRRDAI
jgi:hypothetical protein